MRFKSVTIVAILTALAFAVTAVAEEITSDNWTDMVGFKPDPEALKIKKGKTIKAHRHNLVKREVHFTQEVLFIKRGRLKVDLYSSSKEYMESVILGPGDIILLASGGHGFEILEDLEMIEVKQGPYAGDQDKSYLEAEP